MSCPRCNADAADVDCGSGYHMPPSPNPLTGYVWTLAFRALEAASALRPVTAQHSERVVAPLADAVLACLDLGLGAGSTSEIADCRKDTLYLAQEGGWCANRRLFLPLARVEAARDRDRYADLVYAIKWGQWQFMPVDCQEGGFGAHERKAERLAERQGVALTGSLLGLHEMRVLWGQIRIPVCEPCLAYWSEKHAEAAAEFEGLSEACARLGLGT